MKLIHFCRIYFLTKYFIFLECIWKVCNYKDFKIVKDNKKMPPSMNKDMLNAKKVTDVLDVIDKFKADLTRTSFNGYASNLFKKHPF